MICLCLAIASIGRAMQRQSDNRHHLVTQGMAFLSKYRELRKEEDDAIGEVEFNFGRTFHQLGKQRYFECQILSLRIDLCRAVLVRGKTL